MDGLLLHGWGFQKDVFHKIRKTIMHSYPSITPDLYAMAAANEDVSLDRVVNSLAAQYERKTFIVGWSLGGQLAIKLAHRLSHVAALVLIASAPKMLNGIGWQNTIKPTAFHDLYQSAEFSVNEAIKKLVTLTGYGEKNARKTLLEINNFIVKQIEQKLLLSWLTELNQTDLREQFSQLDIPVMVILGENDVLIKKSIRQQFLQLLPGVIVETISDSGHAPLISHADECGSLILNFIHDVNKSG